MDWLEWAAAVLLIIVGAVILLLVAPVTYRFTAACSGAEGQVKFLGGLWKKTFRYTWAAGKDGDEKEVLSEKPPVLREDPWEPDCRETDIKEPETPVSPIDSVFYEDRAETPSMKETGGESAAEESTPEKPVGGEKEKPTLWETFRYGMKNGAVREALSAAGDLWRHGGPSFFLIRGECGLGDPMETGVLAGWAMTAVPAARGISWDYINMRCRLEAECRGRIIPIYVLWRLLRLAVSVPIRDVWRFRKKGGPS